jgi:single-strand DNA-binding protein
MTAEPATGGPRVWSGQDGSPRASFEVTANTVRFLSSRDESGGGSMGGDMGGNFVGAPEEDIPF